MKINFLCASIENQLSMAQFFDFSIRKNKVFKAMNFTLFH